jgi:hypothetical protein
VARGRALCALLSPGALGEGVRGAGLRLSRAVVERCRGALHVRSGGLVVTAGSGEPLLISRCPRRFAGAPGTQICIRLRGPLALTRRSKSG